MSLPNGKVGRNRCRVLRLLAACCGEQNGLNQMDDFRIFHAEIISLCANGINNGHAVDPFYGPIYRQGYGDEENQEDDP